MGETNNNSVSVIVESPNIHYIQIYNKKCYAKNTFPYAGKRILLDINMPNTISTSAKYDHNTAKHD